MVSTSPTSQSHTKLTLEIVHKPKISGYAQLHGEFNYNTTTLAPPGTQVIVHEKKQWEELGHHMYLKGVISVLPLNTIGAIR